MRRLRCPDHVGVTNVAKRQKNDRLYAKRFWLPGVRFDLLALLHTKLHDQYFSIYTPPSIFFDPPLRSTHRLTARTISQNRGFSHTDDNHLIYQIRPIGNFNTKNGIDKRKPVVFVKKQALR